MGKDIGRIYKHSQPQLTTHSFKEPVLESLASQTSSSIKLTTASVPSVRDKKQNNSILCSENSTHNDLSIKNNDNIQYCETKRKQLSFQSLQLHLIMHNVLLPRQKVC